MENMRVILIKSNLIDLDARLIKVVATLEHSGYGVTFLCWDRECKAPQPEWGEKSRDYREIRLRFRAPTGLKILPILPVWWCFVLFRLLVTKWDVVHALNFDSVVPAVIAAKLKRLPIIYEIVDVYADMIVLPEFIRQISIFIDKFFMRLVNAIIIANEAHQIELNGIPNSNVVGVYNSPPDIYKESDVRGNDTFTLFFAGVLQRSRRMNLDKVYLSIKDMDMVRLIIAGYGNQAKEIREWASEISEKVRFIGEISYTEVLERTIASDLLFALYEPAVPTIRFAGGNKLFEAMMARKPFLVSKGTIMADIVEIEKCGLIVDCNSIDEIKEAITRLKESPELCQQLGANGRRAYEQKYNWRIMEQRLLTLYRKMGRESQGRI